jgi:coiled-coil domain-containing protein 61
MLTQNDLALLKAKKQGIASPIVTEAVDVRSKRYLILTLTGEFEKVHYPLPLTYLEDPGIEVLRRTLTRMQSQVEDFNRSGAWSEQLHSTSKRL